MDFERAERLGQSEINAKERRFSVSVVCQEKEGVLPVGNTSDRRSRRQEGMLSSVTFLCERAFHTANTHNFFFMFLDMKNAVSRYVAAASSASSASMTALSPPMSRITCVGCAAPGGAGVPAGFTHTDARSAASTPPCGGGGAKRRKKRRQSRRAPSASARRRTLSDERSRERRNAVEKTRSWKNGSALREEEEPLLSVTRALPVRPSRASRRRARLRAARTPRRDTP